jgi:hypothetical protein
MIKRTSRSSTTTIVQQEGKTCERIDEAGSSFRYAHTSAYSTQLDQHTDITHGGTAVAATTHERTNIARTCSNAQITSSSRMQSRRTTTTVAMVCVLLVVCWCASMSTPASAQAAPPSTDSCATGLLVHTTGGTAAQSYLSIVLYTRNQFTNPGAKGPDANAVVWKT